MRIKIRKTQVKQDNTTNFLLGLRTPSSEIPATGNVKYLGSWFGYISDGSTSYSPPSGDKKRDNNALAEFNVDFGNKKANRRIKTSQYWKDRI